MRRSEEKVLRSAGRRKSAAFTTEVILLLAMAYVLIWYIQLMRDSEASIQDKAVVSVLMVAATLYVGGKLRALRRSINEKKQLISALELKEPAE